MSVPAIVQSRLDGEQVAAQVPLGGEDGLFVTPTRTLIYRADGLLSDESVEEYPHGAERIVISEGRRKSAIELDYGIDGEEKFKVPSNRLYEALHPVLAGVLNAADVTGPDETVKQTYQFSELTLVITSERVVKHVGAAVWDEDFEEYPFADVTELDVEEGSVSSQIIIESEGRPQRIKTPSDQTREVRERIEQALLDYHGVSSYEEFARQHADPESQADAEGESDDETSDDGDDEAADPLAGGVDPIQANPPELDDEGGIVEDDASMTTGESAEAGGANATAEERTATSADNANADAGTQTSADASADASPNASAGDASAGDASAVADPSSEETDATSETTATTTAQSDDRERAVSETTEETATAGESATTDESVTTGESATGANLTEDAGGATGTADTETATETDSGFADSGFEPASSDLEADSTDEQLQALTEAVERQNELLAEQQRTLEQLIEELSRGR